MRPILLAAVVLAHVGAAGALESQQVIRALPLPADSSVGVRRTVWKRATAAPFVPEAATSWDASSAMEYTQSRVGTDSSADSTAHRRPTAWATLASAIVPGSGQALLRQRRAILYVALEALTLSGYASHSRDARRSRDGYRLLASSVARAPFSEIRPVGDFDYYERMEHYVASGRFDLASNGLPLRPEEDTTTFNGAMWLLARRTYWNDPAQSPSRESVEWIRAEAFYLQRAVRPEYRWSWEGESGQYDSFRQLIRRSNDRYRAALSDLGWTLGNHVLSAIDATVSVRLQRQETVLGRVYGVVIEVPWQMSH